jgi:hypothetical protein
MTARLETFSPLGDLAPEWTPPVVLPGPETAALDRFHFDCTWTGAIEANMTGPGSPRMEGIGKASFAWTDDGLWLHGEFMQDQFIAGQVVMTWKAHYLVGWDPLQRNYVAFLADNCGHALSMRGEIDGDRFILKTGEPGPFIFRLTWDLSDPRSATWANEMSLNRSPWQLIERYALTRSSETAEPVGGEHLVEFGTDR